MPRVNVRDPTELRVAIARLGLPAYAVAGVALVAPSELAQFMRGDKRPTDAQSTRIAQAIDRLAEER